MGRRSINTTKSGKYMNPTDQARKEARKQELKKNKKQRQLVRAAVLKGKDPQQLLEELEKIDQMEYNVSQPSPLNEKVLKDKRKKLRDTLERVLSMYCKDDPEKWSELKRRQTEYEHKRNQLVAFFESVRSAQQVTVDEIPLPQIPQQVVSLQIPLPLESAKKPPEHMIYSIATALKMQQAMKNAKPTREPPGCPPGPPPDIDSDGEVEPVRFPTDDVSDDETTTTTADSTTTTTLDTTTTRSNNLDPQAMDTTVPPPMTTTTTVAVGGSTTTATGGPGDGAPKPKPTSLQQKMVALSGQNVDEFMKEMEVVAQKKADNERKADETVAAAHRPPQGGGGGGGQPHIDPPAPPGTDSVQLKPQTRVTPLTHPYPLRIPPGPPPGRPLLPPGPPPGLPPSHLIPPPPTATPLRLPPPPNLSSLMPPPPGATRVLVLQPPPPGGGVVPGGGGGILLHQQGVIIQGGVQQGQTPNVLTAGPQLIRVAGDGGGVGDDSGGKSQSSATIISARPQIRNLSADVTRFVPSALRVKREDRKLKPAAVARASIAHELKQKEMMMAAAAAAAGGQPTKDDAYMQFMKEMQGLM